MILEREAMKSPAGTDLRHGLEQLLLDCGCILKGHFVLASGRHSDVYVEKFRILERPDVLGAVCKPLVEEFDKLGADIVVGPTTGGILVAFEVARQLGLRAVYVESEGGKRKLRRGAHIPAGSRVVLVDDVLTTGTSLLEVLDVIDSSKAELLAVGVLIDRSESAIDFRAPLTSAVRYKACSYAPAEVPAWLREVPISIPGTRQLHTSR